jgi:hypothetical protein
MALQNSVASRSRNNVSAPAPDQTVKFNAYNNNIILKIGYRAKVNAVKNNHTVDKIGFF